MAAVVAVAASGLWGCPGGTEGECEVDADCGEGLFCHVETKLCLEPAPSGGACSEAGNLVRNGSFECGADGWMKSFANFEMTVVEEGAKAGGKALRLTSTGSSTFHASSEEFTMAPGTVCARGWLRGTTKDGHFRVVWAPTDGSGGRMENFSQPMKPDEWARVQPSRPFSFALPKESKVHVRISAQGESTGSWLEADGVRVWHSADGSCAEP